MSKTFNAPYAGAGALMPIKGDTALSSFSGKELAESSAIHGDFNQASINYSGHQNLEVRGAETFAARGTYNLYKSQEKVLKAYRDSGGKENHYDSLPPKIVNKLESIRNSETLWSDVNRWLWDNPSTSKNPYGGFHSTWDAESFGAELTPRFIPVEVIKYDAWWSRKYGREYNPTLVGNDYDYSYVVCVRDIPIAHFDTKENAENHANTVRTAISVLGGVTPSTIDHPLALKEMLADWDVSVDKLTHQKQTFHVKDKDYESQAKRKALSLAKKKKGGWKNYPEGAGFATPEYEAWFARRARAESFGAEGYGPYAGNYRAHVIEYLLGETSEDEIMEVFDISQEDLDSYWDAESFGAELVGGPCEICGEDLFRDYDDSMGDVCLSCYYEERSKQDDEGSEYDGWLLNFAESFGAEYGKRQRFGNRYIARDTKGRIISNVSVGRSLKADRRNKSKTPARSGFGHKGDSQKGASSDFKLPTDAKSLVGIGAVLGGLWAYLESKA